MTLACVELKQAIEQASEKTVEQMRRNSMFLHRRAVQRLRQFSVAALSSSQIKLLICCCFVFTTFLLAGHLPVFMGWTHQIASSDRNSVHSKGYTLLINTWKRNDLLKQSISHYTTCSSLDSIHIVWSEPDPPSKDLTRILNKVIRSNARDGQQIELKFDVNKEDSLNNRFKEIKDLKTDVVFSIDDDIIFPCSSVELAFNVWQSATDTMVGFVPRIHWIDQLRGSEAPYVYGGWWSVWWMGTYSMVLSKAAFFHKKYLTMYTNEMPVSIKEYVTKNRNCEDIAMSFLVANATGAPPVWVKGEINEIGSTGISSLGGHTEKRSKCVNLFAAEFARMPLVYTSVKAIDSRKTWFW